jgi:hypothetical protein
MKKQVIYILMLLTISASFAIAEKAPIKWGNILPEDINMKVYAADLNAPAVVLCDYGTVAVGPRTEYTRHVRIKILKQEGISYASIEIPYRTGYRYDDFIDMRAQTFNTNEKGELVKSKLKGRNIKDIKIDGMHAKKVFTFPDVKPGSIIEYTYTIRSLDLVKLRDWYFQSTIPVQWSEYRVYISRRFNYLVTFQKGLSLDITEQEGFANRLQWLYNTRTNKARNELMSNNDILYSSPKGNINVYYAWGKSFRYVMKEMPALQPKPNMMAFSDYYPSVKVHLYLADGNFPFYYRQILLAAHEDYNPNDRYSLQYEHGYIAYWLPTWEEVNKAWLKNENLGMRLIKAFDFRPILDKVMDTIGDQTKTARGIYEYVKNNVSWDSTYSMFSFRNLDAVLRSKSASSGEINLLLIGLLRRAGLEVNPILIRTLNQGRIENIYPQFQQFNHVIAQVEIEGKIIYLDAAGKNSAFGELNRNVEGATGWLLKREGANFAVVK